MRVLALLAWTAAVLAAQSGGAVSGCVVTSTHGEPIASATVTLRATTGNLGETYIAHTDGNGCFSATAIAPGAYEARPSKPGYEQRLAGHAEEFASLLIEAGKVATTIRLTLIPDGVITGTVTDDTGNPVRQANVELQQYGYVGGQKRFHVIGSARADDRGKYRLFHVAPGKYRLRASPTNTRPQLRSVNGQIGESSESASGFAAAWYPAAIDGAHAAEIEVAPGAEIDGIDFHLSEQPLYSIRGRILSSADGRSGMNIFAQAIRSPSMPAPTRFDGKQYEVSGLSPGSYVIIGQQFPASPSGGGERLYARQTVEVANRDVDGVDLSFEPGVNVKGVVKVEGSASAQNLNVNFAPLDSMPSELGGFVNADGAFKLQVGPGEYRIQAYGQGIYLKSVAMGKGDVPDFKIDTAHLSGDLTLVVANDFGKVEGIVVDENGKPVSNAEVILEPVRHHDDGMGGVSGLTTRADGKFSIPGLIPGDYRAYAFTGAEAGAGQDPDFRKSYQNRAATVHLEPESKQTLELKAIQVVN